MLSESIGEGFDDGVEAPGSHGGHVEDATDRLASATDGSFAFPGAAIAIERCESNEGGDLLTIEFSDFGDIGDDRGSGDRSQPRHGLDELDFVLPVIVGFEEGLDHFFDAADFRFERIDDGLDAFPGGLGVGNVPAVGLLSFEVDELSPARDELLDFGLFFGSFLAGSRLHFLGEESQDARIDAIGLGYQAEGLGEIAGASGVDHRDAVASVGEVSDHFPFVAAGGLEDDETSVGTREELFELPISGFGVGQGLVLPGRKNVEIERGLGYVDSDGNLVRAIHGDVPFLPMRARACFEDATAQATVRAGFQRPTAILLLSGVLSTR